MPVKKVVSKKIKVSNNTVRPPKEGRVAKSRTTLLSVPVYSLAGRASGTLALPKEVFGVKVNKNLLAQALRVYTQNQKPMTASTKGRGEVHGTTAKMYRQKGTGRARHGAKTAPIFVGGGVAFGPKPRPTQLSLPKKMKKAALISALSDKLQQKQVVSVSGLEKATGKTKEISALLNKLNTKSALIVVGDKLDTAQRAARNIPHVNLLPVNYINAYEVVKYQLLAITKEAVEKLTKGAKK